MSMFLPERIWLQRDASGDVKWSAWGVERLNDDDVEYVLAPSSARTGFIPVHGREAATVACPNCGQTQPRFSIIGAEAYTAVCGPTCGCGHRWTVHAESGAGVVTIAPDLAPASGEPSGAEAVVREAYAVIDEMAPQWSGSSIATVLRAFIETWQAVPDGPAVEELQAFRDALARKGQAVQAARLSLIQRVREFVDEYGYTVPIDPFVERTRIALAEYDRVAASKALPTAPGAPEEGAGE